MVSSRKRKSQQKNQKSGLNETLNDFVSGSNTNVGVVEYETLEFQNDGLGNNPELIVDGRIGGISGCQNQINGNNFYNRIRKSVENAIKAVENPMRGAILTTMNNVVIPRVEMAVRSANGSSGNGTNSAVQNSDRRDFIGNAENTPLKSASSGLDLNIDQDRIDETRDIENSGDGDFPVLESNFDRQAHTHHTLMQ